MQLTSFAHAGLRRLYLKNDASGFPADAADKLRKMLSFLQTMREVQELRVLPTWRAHQLTGHRKGTWALHVTRNYRLTFRIDPTTNEVKELNYEDYH